MRTNILALAGALFCALASGCTTGAHNDVLLFGTDTKVAFDISTNVTNGGAGEFTLGYKRREAVWMPMVVNGSNSAVIATANQAIVTRLNACTERAGSNGAASVACFDQAGREMAALRTAGGAPPPQDAMYQGHTEGVSRRDGEDRSETDTYSVFASFGGDFSGLGEGRAALAQFFATGIAAQRLGENPRIDSALSVQSGEREANDALRGALDQVAAQNQQLGASAVAAAAQTYADRVTAIVSCLGGNDEKRAAAITELRAQPALVPAIDGQAPAINAGEQGFRAALNTAQGGTLIEPFYNSTQVKACRGVTNG